MSSEDISNGPRNEGQTKEEGAGREVDVVLDIHPSPARAGETLKGTLTLSSQGDPVILKSIYILLYGEARTHWSHDTANEQLSFTDREVFFHEFLTLWDHLTRGEEEIEDDHRKFDFRYFMPPDLPASYAGNVGTIRYFGEATVCLIIGESEKVLQVRRFFVVIGREMVDMAPVIVQKLLNFPVCCCSKPQSISCRFEISQGAYKVGESISIKGRIDNKSRNRKVRGLIISLVQIAICTAESSSGKSESNSEETIVTTIEDSQAVSPGSFLKWKKSIQIPETVSPSISSSSSRLIVVYHVVKCWGRIVGFFRGRMLLGELSVHIN